LTVIGDAVVNIKAARNIEIDIDNIPLDDPATYDMLCRADTSGVFQLESSGMRKVLRNLHPESLEDIIALVALYRPGPLGSGMVDDFIDRKNGRKKVTLSFVRPDIKRDLWRDALSGTGYAGSQCDGRIFFRPGGCLKKGHGQKKA
jgi:DNA polymerase III alpha subunit